MNIHYRFHNTLVHSLHALASQHVRTYALIHISPAIRRYLNKRQATCITITVQLILTANSLQRALKIAERGSISYTRYNEDAVRGNSTGSFELRTRILFFIIQLFTAKCLILDGHSVKAHSQGIRRLLYMPCCVCECNFFASHFRLVCLRSESEKRNRHSLFSLLLSLCLSPGTSAC